MAHVITQSCCNDATCVAVCPADCIHPRPDEPDYPTAEMLYIDPRLCVDCGACIEACPVAAIVPDDELTPSTQAFAEINAHYFESGPGRHHRRSPAPRPPRPMGLAIAGVRAPEPRPRCELRVAVVGSGPSACYAADDLLSRHPDAAVTMVERLPTPWGLVRAGVAPDHPETKEVIRLFQRMAAHPGFTFFLNVEVGRHLSHDELLAHHDAVIYAVGASADRRLGVPGEDLPGSHSATDFVAWYNGHPDAAGFEFDLGVQRAVIVGNGNVALDVARILVSDIEDLRRTDIADHALEALAGSSIEEVVVLGRRGPAEAAYTTPELLALAHLPHADVVVDPAEAELDPASAAFLANSDDAVAVRKVSVVRHFATAKARRGRRIALRYLRSPLEILGEEKVRGIRIVRNVLVHGPGDHRLRPVPTGETEVLSCGLVMRSVGYRGVPLPGLPFDATTATLPQRAGRVIQPDTGEPRPGVYAAGWIKRGPSGVIGTNKKCAQDTVTALLEDHRAGRLATPASTSSALRPLLVRRQPDVLDYEDWKTIDEHERALGTEAGRPRVKLVDRREMLAVAREGSAVTAKWSGRHS